MLPNHHLLRLAERPPKDIASLLALVQPVPPVLRQRAGELLEIIKVAVAAASDSEQVDAVSTEVVPVEEKGKEIEMDVSASVPSSHLWTGDFPIAIGERTMLTFKKLLHKLEHSLPHHQVYWDPSRQAGIRPRPVLSLELVQRLPWSVFLNVTHPFSDGNLY